MSLIDTRESRDGTVVVEVYGIREWWIKIKHVGSDPKVGELNMTSDRAVILAELLNDIISRH